MCACVCDNAVYFTCNQNANVKAKTNDGYTARTLALKYNQMMIVSLVDNAQYVQNYASECVYLVLVSVCISC